MLYFSILLKVCRVAYEIMQEFYPDASDRFRSLDDIYYFGGQAVHRYERKLTTFWLTIVLSILIWSVKKKNLTSFEKK